MAADVEEQSEANAIDLEDVPAKPVDGVKQKQIFKSEREIPEVAAPAEVGALPGTEGDLYGRAGAPGESGYEGGVLHLGKDAGTAAGNERDRGEGQEENEGDDGGGNRPYAYQGDDVDGEGGAGNTHGGTRERERFAHDEYADQNAETEEGGTAPQESSAVGQASGNMVKGALEKELRETTAVETAGASEVVLWMKKHPQATIAIVCALLLVLLVAVVLLVVLLGEFACNSTVSGVASWIYGHVGGTDYCSMLPKIT